MSYQRTTFRMKGGSWERSVAWARHLRQNATAGEASLWNLLRARRLAGAKFRRQHPIGPFIFDFYAPAFRRVVEVDGPGHVGHEIEDGQRQRRLEHEGVRFLRLRTDEIERELDACSRRIEEALAESW